MENGSRRPPLKNQGGYFECNTMHSLAYCKTNPRKAQRSRRLLLGTWTLVDCRRTVPNPSLLITIARRVAAQSLGTETATTELTGTSREGTMENDAHVGAAAAAAASASASAPAVATTATTPTTTRTRTRTTTPFGFGDTPSQEKVDEGRRRVDPGSPTAGEAPAQVQATPIAVDDNANAIDDDDEMMEEEEVDNDGDDDSTSNSLVAVPLSDGIGVGVDPGVTPRRSNRSNSNEEQQQGAIAGGVASIRGAALFSSVAVSSVPPSNNAAAAAGNAVDADDAQDIAEDPGPESSGDRSCRYLRNAVRFLCFPVFVAVSIVGLVLFLLFFCFPLLVFFLLLICVYYCCTDEPIPPRVLFRALWEDNTDSLAAAAGNNGAGGASQAASPYTIEEILARIVSRRLLEVIAVDPEVAGGNNDKDGPFGLGSEVADVRKDPCHDGPVYLTDHDGTVLLRFSAPLAPVANKESSIDDGAEPGGNDDDGGHIAAENPFVVAYGDDDEHEQETHAAGSDGASSDVESPTADPDPDSSATSPMSVRIKSAAAATTTTSPATMTTSHMACDICLCEFERGDVLAWSRNRTCSHHFHRDCVVDWLRRRTTCPSCRQEFVQPN